MIGVHSLLQVQEVHGKLPITQNIYTLAMRVRHAEYAQADHMQLGSACHLRNNAVQSSLAAVHAA